jgi:hypothetical protein
MVIYMNSRTSDTPLACNMDVFTPTERADHIQSTTQLYRCVQSIHEAENGFEFTFPNESGIITGLGNFILNERLCCPFLEFTLRLTSKHSPVSLLLTGPEGTREFLRAELPGAFE